MKTYTITKQNFLEWFFNTGDLKSQKESRTDLGKRAIERLLRGEDFFYSVEDAFNECSIESIPIMFLEEFKNDGYDELEVGDLDYECEVTLID
jgi:hypothetical protein